MGPRGTRDGKRRAARSVSAPFLVAIALLGGLLAGCAGQASREDAPREPTLQASAAPEPEVMPPARDVFFPRMISASGAIPDGMGGGKLTVDERGCLRAGDRPSSETPLWPPGYELRTGGGGIRVLDKHGKLKAKVGKEVQLHGGFTDRDAIEEGGGLQAKAERELFERCPGPYFAAYGAWIPQ